MRKIKLLLSAAALLLFFLTPSKGFAMEQVKIAMERSLEDRVQNAIGKLLDPAQFLLIVKVEPYTADEWKTQKSGVSGPAYILPGIPERTDIDKFKDSTQASDVFWQSRPFVKRIRLTLFLDKRVPNNLAQEVEILVKQMIDFNPARGDEMRVQRIFFQKGLGMAEAQPPVQYMKLSMDQIKTRGDFHWLALVAVLGGFLLLLIGGLVFSARKFLKTWQSALPAGQGAGHGALGGGGSGGGGGGKFELDLSTPLSVTMGPSKESKYEIFQGEPEKHAYNFINDRDVVTILQLLREEPPLHLAIIAYYLRPCLASGFIDALDSQTRLEVMASLAAPQTFMRDDVKELGKTLKEKVRGIVYGADQFFAIYDAAPTASKGELMKALEAQVPVLAEKMRNEMFTFEDLLSLDSAALRVVFREAPLRSLAVSLMGTPAAARDRMLASLPSGAAEIIRQEIDMNSTQNQRLIEDERRKVVSIVRRLVWDNRIMMPSRQHGPRAPAAPSAGSATRFPTKV